MVPEPETVTIRLLDQTDPSYSRTVAKVGDDAYLVVGIDRARGLLLLERIPTDPAVVARQPGAEWGRWTGT